METGNGIDGVIIIDDKEIPVSVKSKTYVNQEKHLSEELRGYLIVYEKKKNKIVVDYSELLNSIKK